MQRQDDENLQYKFACNDAVSYKNFLKQYFML